MRYDSHLEFPESSPRAMLIILVKHVLRLKVGQLGLENAVHKFDGQNCRLFRLVRKVLIPHQNPSRAKVTKEMPGDVSMS